MITIKVRELYKRYNYELYNGLSFTASSECPLIITGKNGSGKSTLLNIICGLKKPDAGSVGYNFDNEKPSLADVKNKTSIVSPYVNPYACLKLNECVGFVSKGNQSQIEKTKKMCGEFDLDINEIYGNLSGGMMQKFKISLAVASDPSVLLLDEPFAMMDDAGIKIINSIVKSSSAAIILATNDKKRLGFEFSEAVLG